MFYLASLFPCISHLSRLVSPSGGSQWKLQHMDVWSTNIFSWEEPERRIKEVGSLYHCCHLSSAHWQQFSAGWGEYFSFPNPSTYSLLPKKKEKGSVMEGKGAVDESQRRGRHGNAGLSKIKMPTSAGDSTRQWRGLEVCAQREGHRERHGC